MKFLKRDAAIRYGVMPVDRKQFFLLFRRKLTLFVAAVNLKKGAPIFLWTASFTPGISRKKEVRHGGGKGRFRDGYGPRTESVA